MAESSSDESDGGFPGLPPTVMLNLLLGSDDNEGQTQFQIVSDVTTEEDCQPEIFIKDETDTSSSSSESDQDDHRAAARKPEAKEKKHKQEKSSTVAQIFKGGCLGEVDHGAVCGSCNQCDGFEKHKWRRVCNNCKCTKEDHEISNDELNEKINNMKVIDSNDNLEDQENMLQKYAWIPPGLDAALVDSYMKSLPENQVPLYDSAEGMQYRNRQLLLQFPVQDLKYENCKNIPEKSKYLFDQFSKKHESEAATGHVEKAFRLKECKNCHEDIAVGSAYVLAFNLGEDAAWHPACFSCSKCCQLLVNLIFYHSDGEIFCGRHFAETTKSRCVACDELILFGEYVKAAEQTYHIHHFCCWICDAELSGKQHLVEAQQPICIDCYNNKFANSCNKCKKKISMEDKDILYDNHHWHDTCLLCVICNEGLSGRSFLTRDNGEFICADCHKQTDTRRCKTCEQGFEPGMKRLELNGVFWHEKCFVCELCKDPISSKRFMRHQDLTVCVKCYEDAFIKRCIVCVQPLTDGGISYNGEPYHKECFACAKCNVSIASKAFSVKDGKNYCPDCYSGLFAKKCKACADYILTGEYYTLDEDSWHKHCFRCTKCDEPLASTSFVQDGDEILLMCESCI